MKINEKVKQLKDDTTLYTLYLNMNEFKPNIHEWKPTDLDTFLKTLGLTSRNTILKYLGYMKVIHEYCCDEANVSYSRLMPSSDFTEYIDYPKLKSKTIETREEFISVKNLLKYRDANVEGNYRDVVLFLLAWLGLTASDIKNLKKDDIIELKDENGNNYIKIIIEPTVKVSPKSQKEILKDSREIIVKDFELVEDILGAKYETEYYKTRAYQDREYLDIIPLVQSKYLIRGIKNGNTKEDLPIDSPNKALNQQLRKYTHPKLDLEHLSIEDIRRSRAIYAILQHKDIMTPAMLTTILGTTIESDVGWLIKVAEKMQMIDNKEE